MTIFDVYGAKIISAKWLEDALQREPYLGEAFYTERKQLGTELSMIQGKRPVPKMLNLSSFDAKVISISPEAFKKITTDMPFFKNDMKINEKLRQELLKVLASGNEAYINSVVGEIYNYDKQLLANAEATKEAMRMSALTTGVVTFANNGQSVSYDYGFNNNNKKTTDWTDTANADPIADIESWQDEVESATGVRPTNILLNRSTFNLMKKADAVKNAIYIVSQGKVTPNNSALKEHILTETGCTVYIYDKGYTDVDSNTYHKFVSDNTVVLFPDGAVGEFVYGTTPEEADLMGGIATDAEVVMSDMGVALTTTKETDPVTVKTKVSMIALPTITAPDTIILASVGGEE